MKRYLRNKNLNSKYFNDLAYIIFNEFSPDDLKVTPETYNQIICSFETIANEFQKIETENLTFEVQL